MHSYQEHESQNGSHFFIQTPNECKYLLVINNTEEEYVVDFLDDNIQNSYISRFTIDNHPNYPESNELFKTIRHIIYNHINNNDVIVKIEFDNTKSRKDLITNYFNESPEQVKGLTHVVNGNSVYYFFNSLRIESTTLITSLIKEFSQEESED